ncbi:MAG: DUF3365 domain-containing protein [Planctomycetaceae bacterium]|nr:DUF3365 domain-containing protein [Planctomycetaceae bacterium]
MMKKLLISVSTLAFVTALIVAPSQQSRLAKAEDKPAKSSKSRQAEKPDQAAIKRARKIVNSLDNIFKQTIVLITDKYVHDESDFAAGSAAVLLFKNISESGDNKVRLIDATGEPYDPANVAKDKFEKTGLERLKSGAELYEQVVAMDGKPFLRTLTPVPVVMKKCVMCHPHYKDAKDGEPIGAISYTVPIE